jgi:uncharacterized protein YgiM (DUF1202 family)
MRKPLFALGLLCSAGIGVFSLAGVLVTSLQASTRSISLADTISSRVRAEGSLSAASRTLASGVSGAAIVQYATKFLGYPYTATGNSPSTGFSCIGFVSYVYRSLGINLPGDLDGAMAFAPQMAFSSLLPGDILYFQNTVWPGLSHAAIYIGGGKFVHAEWYNRGVVISSFTNDPVDGNYWTAHYLGANRPWTGGASAAVAAPPTVQPTPSTGITPTPVPTRATRQIPSGPTASVRVSALNVRARPSLRATIRTVVTQGTRLVVLGHRRGWYRVALPNGAFGWVIGAGIGMGAKARPEGRVIRRRKASASSSGALPIGHPPASRRTNIPTQVHTQGSVVVQVNGLRVHTAPSFGARLIGSVNRGQHLAVVSRTHRWIRVRLPDSSIGWISSQFVQLPSTRPAPKVRTVISRSASGAPRAKPAMHIARAALNVRRGPSLGAAIVSILPVGGSYRILGWSAGWAHVRLADGGTGWISGSVLGTASAAASATSTRSGGSSPNRRSTAGMTSIVTAGVRIHSAPGLSSPVVGLVAAGTHVRALGSSAGWTRVRLPTRQTGYILGIYVK